MPTYQLGASATYYTEGDLVLVPIYLLDPVADTYNPQVVREGTCELWSGGEKIDSTAEFDYRFGTADGNFQVIFNHPSSLHALSVKMDLVVINGTGTDDYHFETHVLYIESEETGLAAQPPETEE